MLFGVCFFLVTQIHAYKLLWSESKGDDGWVWAATLMSLWWLTANMVTNLHFIKTFMVAICCDTLQTNHCISLLNSLLNFFIVILELVASNYKAHNDGWEVATYLAIGETVQHSHQEALAFDTTELICMKRKMTTSSCVCYPRGVTWNELRVRLIKFLA